MTKLQFIAFFTLLLFATVGISSCNIVEPEVIDVESFKITKMGATGGSFNVGVRIKNINNLKFTIVSCDMDVYSGKSKIGTAVVANNIVIKKKSEDLHMFKVDAKFAGLGGALSALLSFGGSKTYTFKGDIKVRSLGVSRKFPLEFSHSL